MCILDTFENRGNFRFQGRRQVRNVLLNKRHIHRMCERIDEEIGVPARSSQMMACESSFHLVVLEGAQVKICWTCKKEIFHNETFSYWSHKGSTKITHGLCGFAHLDGEAPIPLGNQDWSDDDRWPANWKRHHANEL